MNSKAVAVVLTTFLICSHALELQRADPQNGFTPLSSDLGDYAFFKCSKEGSDRTCTFDTDEGMTYASGIGIYGAANIVAYILVILLCLLNVFSNVVCCFYWCCTKFCCAKKNGQTIDDPTAKYSCMDYWRMCSFTIVIIGIPILCILGTFMGNVKLSENSTGIVNAPAGFQGMMASFEPTASDSFIFVVSEVMVPFVQGMNRTLNAGMNLTSLLGAFVVLNATLPKLPRVQVILDTGFGVADIVNVDAPALVDELVDEFSDLADTIANIELTLGNVTEFLDTIAADNVVLLAVLSDTSDTLTDVRDTAVFMLGDGGSNAGIIAGISDDLDAMPASAPFADGETKLENIKDGTLDSNVAGIQAVAASLTTVYNSLLAAPNYTVTAQNLVLVNDTMKGLVAEGGLFDQLSNDIFNISYVLGNYSNFTAAAQLLLSLDSDVRSINITVFTILIDQLLDLLVKIPAAVTIVYNEADKMRELTELIAIPRAIRDQIVSCNTSLFRVPNKVQGFDILDMMTNFESDYNVTKLIKELDKILKNVTDINETISEPIDQVRDARSQVGDFQSTIDDAIDSFDVNSLVDNLKQAQDQITSVNFTTALKLIDTLRENIADFTVQESFATNLRDLQTYFQIVTADLQRVVAPTTGGPNSDSIGDYLLLSRGSCTGSAATICNVDSDCPGSLACINKGSFRCKNNGALTCTQDSGCPSSYCLADRVFAATLQGELDAFSNVEIDSSALSDVLGQLENFDSSVNELNGAIDSIDSARDSTSSFDVVSARDRVVDVSDGIADADVPGKLDILVNAREKLDDVPNVREKLKPYKDYGKKQEEYEPRISKMLADTRTTLDFIFKPSRITTMYSRLSSASLTAKYTADGPGALARFVFTEIDETFAALFDVIDYNLTKVNTLKLAKNFEILDKMGGYGKFSDMNDNGALYYLLRLGNQDTVRADFATVMGVWVDSNYEEYPNGDTCTTSSCEAHTMDVINNDKLSEWSKEIPSFTAGDSIGFTRDQIWLFMWIPPLLTSLLAMFVCCCNFKMYRPCGRRFCTVLFQGLVFCQLPFILFFTFFLFTFSLVLQDMCTTGGNVGNSYIVAYGDSFCKNQFGGAGTLDACEFNFQDSFNTTFDYLKEEDKTEVQFSSIGATIDIVDMYNKLVVQCDPNNDPLHAMMLEIADQVSSFPVDGMAGLLKNAESVELRPGVKQFMTDTADSFSGMISNFVVDAADNSFNCARVSDIFVEMSGSTCGSFVNPMLWMIGTFYLCAWILVCCAFPAGCFKKRYTQIPVDESGVAIDQAPEREDLMQADEVDCEEGESEGEEAMSPGSEEQATSEPELVVAKPVNGTTGEIVEVEIADKNWV